MAKKQSTLKTITSSTGVVRLTEHETFNRETSRFETVYSYQERGGKGNHYRHVIKVDEPVYFSSKKRRDAAAKKASDKRKR